MSKRITLTDREISIMVTTIKHAVATDKYHIEHSLVVGKLGHEELQLLLDKLEPATIADAKVTDLVATDAKANKDPK